MTTTRLHDLDELRRMRRAVESSASGVYFLFLDDALLYVGKSVQVESRIAQHMRFKPFSFNAWSVVRLPAEPMELLTAYETAYILKYRPLWNMSVNGAALISNGSWRMILQDLGVDDLPTSPYRNHALPRDWQRKRTDPLLLGSYVAQMKR